MIFLYILIAIFIAWIWVDYYRLIDVYEGESLKYLILDFFLGSCSVWIVFGLDYFLLDYLPFELNGEFINDFLFCVFRIGMVEELAKIVPFIIVYKFLSKQFNEPIDYLAFICIGALGFSATENVMYFDREGPYVINGRAILSTVGHMIDTSLIAYGIIRYKYFHKKNRIPLMILFFFLAALSHGFYDFWLIYEGSRSWGWFITVVYFLVTISVFAVILNNAINNSSLFSYKKIINSNKVAGRLLMYYVIVFAMQFVLLVFLENATYAVINLITSLYFSGLIIVISCIRLSRFKLIQNRWEKLKFELPFYISPGEAGSIMTPSLRISIKGDSFNDSFISVYYEDFFSLNPLSQRNSYLEEARMTYMESKIFLKNNETFYLVKVFEGDENSKHEKFLLKPKTNGNTMMYGKYPVVGVLSYENESDLENVMLSVSDFTFTEWAYIKPRTDLERVSDNFTGLYNV